MTAGIVAPDVSGVVATELGFLSSFASFEDAPLRFEPYQAAFLDERASFRSSGSARTLSRRIWRGCAGRGGSRSEHRASARSRGRAVVRASIGG